MQLAACGAAETRFIMESKTDASCKPPKLQEKIAKMVAEVKGQDGAREYWYYDVKMNFAEAQAKCKAKGPGWDVATACGDKEISDMQAQIMKRAWIGLSKSGDGWTWADKQTHNDASCRIFRFGEGYPKDDDEFLQMSMNGTYRDKYLEKLDAERGGSSKELVEEEEEEEQQEETDLSLEEGPHDDGDEDDLGDDAEAEDSARSLLSLRGRVKSDSETRSFCSDDTGRGGCCVGGHSRRREKCRWERCWGQAYGDKYTTKRRRGGCERYWWKYADETYYTCHGCHWNVGLNDCCKPKANCVSADKEGNWQNGGCNEQLGVVCSRFV
jgi:hypothetical protein